MKIGDNLSVFIVTDKLRKIVVNVDTVERYET